jgi:hypothetical protein
MHIRAHETRSCCLIVDSRDDFTENGHLGIGNPDGQGPS